MVRFAHLADCHIGAWRDPKLSELVDEAFAQTIQKIIEEDVDFAIIAGDLFNTALPPIERLKSAVRELEKLKKAGIPMYFVAGSHDYSPTGKTMLEVLEEARLGTNVFRGVVENKTLTLKPITDAATSTQITGILGRAGQLDSALFEQLNTQNLEILNSPKIFVFHAALAELTPKKLQGPHAKSVSLLPKGFDYYAGGHVHITEEQQLDGYKQIVYPGPLFPASFSELEELKHGSFCIVELETNTIQRIPIKTKPVTSIHIHCDEKTPQEVHELIKEQIPQEPQDHIILVRVSGQLTQGTASDIEFRDIFNKTKKNGAYACLKNTNGVRSPELIVDEEMDASSTEEAENQVIEEYADSLEVESISKQEKLMHELMHVLSQSQAEGETKTTYEKRVVEEAQNAFEN